MNIADSALETLGHGLQNTCINKMLAALVRDSGGQKVPPILKFLRCNMFFIFSMKYQAASVISSF